MISTAIANATGGIVDGLMKGLDGLFTSDEERSTARLRLISEMNKPHILQAMTTLKEAAHPSWFVAGWRPAIGWICAFGLAYQFLIMPFAALIAHFANLHADLPALDDGALMTMTMTLLGMGGLRTVEKFKGVARSQ